MGSIEPNVPLLIVSVKLPKRDQFTATQVRQAAINAMMIDQMPSTADNLVAPYLG